MTVAATDIRGFLLLSCACSVGRDDLQLDDNILKYAEEDSNG